MKYVVGLLLLMWNHSVLADDNSPALQVARLSVDAANLKYVLAGESQRVIFHGEALLHHEIFGSTREQRWQHGIGLKSQLFWGANWELSLTAQHIDKSMRGKSAPYFLSAVGGSFRQPIFQGLISSDVYSKKEYSEEIKKTEIEYKQAIYQRELQIIQLCMQHELAQEKVKASEKYVTQIESQRNRIRALAAAGKRAPSDEIEASIRLEAAKRTLFQEKLAFEKVLSERESEKATCNNEKISDVLFEKSLALNKKYESNPSIFLQREIFEERLEIIESAIALQQTKAAVNRFMPALDLTFDAKVTGADSSYFFSWSRAIRLDGVNWGLGLSFSWILFAEEKNKIQQIQQTRKILETRNQTLQKRQYIDGKFMDLAANLRELENLKEEQKIDQEILNAKEQIYLGGKIPWSEWADLLAKHFQLGLERASLKVKASNTMAQIEANFID